MAIPNYPVWSISPNWKDGITERLEFLSDVLGSSNGSEQRRGLRTTPRRSFELDFNPVGPERSFFELALQRQGVTRWLLPLFHDKGKLTEQADMGDTQIKFDNTFREFVVGGWAILLGREAFDYEVVEIEAMSDTGITLTTALGKTWPVGWTIMPLRVAWVDQQSTVGALTSRVGDSSVLFTLDGANPYPADPTTELEYLGRTVITRAPNRDKALQITLTRMSFLRDGLTGPRYIADDAGRAFSTQPHNWFATGRIERDQVRRLLYKLDGKRVSVWLPTFNADVELAREVTNGSTRINIRKCGFAYTGGVTSGRNLILIGGQVLKITGYEAPLSPDEERLVLSAPIVGTLAKGLSGSFLDAARMDSDTVEITHHTDSEGPMEVSSSFRAFRDDRNPAGVIYNPLPIAIPSTTPCGTPDLQSACNPIFTGAFLVVNFRMDPGPVRPGIVPGGSFTHTPYFKVYPPRGKNVSGIDFDGYGEASVADMPLIGQSKEYGSPEFPDSIQPNLRGQTLVRYTKGQAALKFEFFYPFPGAIFGDTVNFYLFMQYGAFTFRDDGVLHMSYQWLDMVLPSAEVPLGWVGGLWPVRYNIPIPNHTQDYDGIGG